MAASPSTVQPDSPSFERTEQHFEVIAKAPNFTRSECPVYRERKIVSEDEFSGLLVCVSLYGDGKTDENKGYVSLDITACITIIGEFENYESYGLLCFVSVIDIFGNKRFLSSYSLNYDPYKDGRRVGHSVINVDRFISRETLLNESSDLLPDDCLTIHMDITCILEPSLRIPDNHYMEDLSTLLRSSFENVEDPADSSIYKINFKFPNSTYMLILNSPIAQCLCEVSRVFSDMFRYTTLDKSTEKVNIPGEEVLQLAQIFIITRRVEIKFGSISEICQLYVVADKYDVPTVIKICRKFLKRLLHFKDYLSVLKGSCDFLPNLLELAENYHDGRLRDIIDTFLELRRQFEGNIQRSEMEESLPDMNTEHLGPLVISFRLDKLDEDVGEDC